MSDNFYRIFEDKFRGSRELIQSRLEVYLPFLKSLLEFYPDAQALDLGCGRGEWLELLTSNGFRATGVDLDLGMLEACKARGLQVETADAIAYIASQPNESQVVVSAFHVVEHIEFDQLRVLVTEALRVLKPGGLLMLETPNPENIAVATRNFYLDPTHQRPIPPQLLAFVAEFTGFERVKTLRLQEPKEIANCEKIGLTEVLNSVSPDYAVIAQKKGDATLMAMSQALFDAEYGVSLDTLSGTLDQRLARIEAQAVQGIKLAKQAEAKAQQHLMQLQATYNSSSWRITKPLRACKTALQPLIGKVMRLAMRKGKALARRVPLIKQTVLWLLRRSPQLMQLVTRFSDTSIIAALAHKKTILHFAELRSARIMFALSQLPAHYNEGPVTFLEVGDDVR